MKVLVHLMRFGKAHGLVGLKLHGLGLRTPKMCSSFNFLVMGGDSTRERGWGKLQELFKDVLGL